MHIDIGPWESNDAVGSCTICDHNNIGKTGAADHLVCEVELKDAERSFVTVRMCKRALANFSDTLPLARFQLLRRFDELEEQ